MCQSPHLCRDRPQAESPCPPREPGGSRNASSKPVPAIAQNTNHSTAFKSRGKNVRGENFPFTCEFEGATMEFVPAIPFSVILFSCKPI